MSCFNDGVLKCLTWWTLWMSLSYNSLLKATKREKIAHGHGDEDEREQLKEVRLTLSGGEGEGRAGVPAFSGVLW